MSQLNSEIDKVEEQLCVFVHHDGSLTEDEKNKISAWLSIETDYDNISFTENGQEK